ncbi:DNA polymerase/3'-5' exonuclease PolX [Dictyobacter arantiisoli]|uniref:DNA polymerase beta n=1 Tax=Dictyobacter arantiisoli TaxID=2014874 RepID=A0A5A5TCN5_9CHLR|nr:DNA polymerase/3'-5' exonuclease PolX [Dictyobacter arantiisoli]GCF09280.1 DNA polymerase/3'-5' exonuclease PolX [Dictyobacter arantiisoli]
MDKNQVAALLEEIAVLLTLKEGSNSFEIRAYENAARAVGSLEGEIGQLVREGKLKGTPGLGPTLIKRIEEAVTTEHIAFYDELVANTPQVKLDMLRIPGLGPKRINLIYQQVNVTSLAELEQACKDDKVAHLPGFGKKTQDKILQGLEFVSQHADRYLYSVGEAEGERIRAALVEQPGVVRLQIAGSLRRRRETVKDIDMVLSVDDQAGSDVRRALMDFFTSQPSVKAITGKGETKSSVILQSGIAMDLRVVGDSQFPYTLHHFTGSREHHIPLRRRALSMDMTINDYGLFQMKDGQETLIPCKTEADIYAALQMDYVEPELREDTGEIDAAARHALPTLVQESDLRGVLHVHSTWSDGQNSIREMAEACIARGYSYMGLTDHSKLASYANGLHADDLKRQGEEIDRLNEEFAGRFHILKGTECDILRDGTLDFDDETLASLDFVVASIHSNFNLPQAEQTQRMLRAIANPYVDIIGHSTGRILLGRPGYPLDLDQVIEAAAEHGTCIEINAHPSRLDLDWRYVRKARDKGIQIPIDPDAHALVGIDDMRYGIGVARKGWLRASDVLNTKDFEALVTFFHVRRSKK